MDLVKNAKQYRDNAISVWQNTDNPPQVRARAYLYADVMQHYLGDKEPRPETIPSLAAYQCAVIGDALRSYAMETGGERNAFSYQVNNYEDWVYQLRTVVSPQFLSATTATMARHLSQVFSQYEGADISQRAFHELKRWVEVHALTVISVLFYSLEHRGADEPNAFLDMLLKVPPEQWGRTEDLLPALATLTLPIFSVEGDGKGGVLDVDQTPAIAGFAPRGVPVVFFMEIDNTEADRLLEDGAGAEQIGKQIQLTANLGVAHIFIEQGKYPLFPGHVSEINISSSVIAYPAIESEESNPPDSDPEDEDLRPHEDVQLADPSPEFAEALANHLRNMGIDEPMIHSVRTQFDFSLSTGRGHDVFMFMRQHADSIGNVIPLLRYGDNALTSLVSQRVYENDDFFGAIVLFAFGVPPNLICGKEPLKQALSEQRFNIACALLVPHSSYRPAEELGRTWVSYRDALRDPGPSYLAWQLMNTVMFEADEAAHARALESIKEGEEHEEHFVAYHQHQARTVRQAGAFQMAYHFFKQQEEEAVDA